MKISTQMRWLILSFFGLALLSPMAFAKNNDAIKSEIYSKIECLTCRNMTIDKCNCPKAREMKAYIEALLDTEMAAEEIFYRVAKKFSLRVIMDRQIRAEVEKRLVQETGGKMAKAVLDISSFNLGTVSKGQGKVSHIFKLHNRGNGVLIVKNLKASCPCVTVSLKIGKNKTPYFGTNGAPADWQIQVNPGKSAEIEVVIDLQHRTVSVGKLMREVYINTNDVLNPETTLRIEAEVTD